VQKDGPAVLLRSNLPGIIWANEYLEKKKVTTQKKLLYLGVFTLLMAVVTCFFPRLAQDPAYHHFADTRSWLGIPNAGDVLSNILFLLVGCYGLWSVRRSRSSGAVKVIYAIVFLGVAFTGVGSGWYHLAPDNDRLVWDRLPMVIIFMSFLAAVIAGWAGERVGLVLLIPLLLIGVASVFWWAYTERQGRGDLRFYGFVQFYPMIVTPILLLLQKRVATQVRDARLLLLWVVFWYLLAKAAEHWDQAIFTSVHFISGHSLKHILAAVACYYICRYFVAAYGRVSH